MKTNNLLTLAAITAITAITAGCAVDRGHQPTHIYPYAHPQYRQTQPGAVYGPSLIYEGPAKPAPQVPTQTPQAIPQQPILAPPKSESHLPELKAPQNIPTEPLPIEPETRTILRSSFRSFL